MEKPNNKLISGVAMATAIIMFLAQFLPIAANRPFSNGYRIMIPMLEILKSSHFPLFSKFLTVLPLICAIAIFVARKLEDQGVRIGIYFAAGYLPFILSIINPVDIGEATFLGRGLGPFGGPVLALMTVALGIILLTSAGIAGRVNRRKPLPAIFAGIAGGMLLLALFLPLPFGMDETIMLAQLPFKLFDLDAVVALAFVVPLLIWIFAAIAGIVWAVRHKAGINASKLILILLLIGTGGFLALGLLSLSFTRANMGGSIFLSISTSMLYFAAVFGSSMLSKTLGIAELISKPEKSMAAVVEEEQAFEKPD